MSLLLLLGGFVTLILGFSAWRRSPGRGPLVRAGLGSLLVAYTTPALLLLLATLLWGGDMTRFRVALLALGFRFQGTDRMEVSIGGSREHDVWIDGFSGLGEDRNMALGTLALRPASAGGPRALCLRASERQPSGFLEAGGHRILRDLELRAGDVIEAAGGSWTVERAGLLGLASDDGFRPPAGSEIRIPRRWAKIPILDWPLPVLKPASVHGKRYPLDWLEGPAEPGTEALGFLHHVPGVLGGRLHLTVRDGGVRVLRGGAALLVPSEVDIDQGSLIRVFRLPEWDGSEFGARGARERRRLLASSGDRSIVLKLDPPDVRTLRISDLRELNVSVSERSLRVHLGMGERQLVARGLSFGGVSNRTGSECLALFEFPGTVTGYRLDRFEVATPRGVRAEGAGRAFWIGESVLAALQVDVLKLPVWLVAMAFLLALTKAVAAHAARFTFPHLVVAAALEQLLTVRLLLGYRVWMVTPYSDEAQSLALAGWCFLPWAFIMAALPAPPVLLSPRPGFSARRRRLLSGLLPEGWFPAAAGLAFSAVWCCQVARPVWLWSVLALLILFAGPLLRVAIRGLGSARRLVWLAALLCLVRGVLGLAGFKESLDVFGFRVALSILHVPLALLLQAAVLGLLWRLSRSRGRPPAVRDFGPALAVLLLAWVLPAVIVSDLGLVLLNVPVFLVILFLLAEAASKEQGVRDREWPVRRRLMHLPKTALWAWVALIFCPFVLWLAFYLLGTEGILNDRNILRLLHFASPSRLVEVGTRPGEEHAIMSAVMRAYTHDSLLGKGFGGAEISPHIRPTALREHAPSVLLSGDWGLVGCLGTLLAYLALLLAAPPLMPWRRRPVEPGQETPQSLHFAYLGALAILTLAVPSALVMLANYELALFTGKNAYLLGLDSMADLLEALVLSFLAGLGTAVVRDGESPG